jgi:hypothetical protein
MNFARHHFSDILCILAGLALLFSVIGKSSKNPRALFFFRLASIMLLIGGGFRCLRYFQNIGWVHHYDYQVFYYGFLLKAMAAGMMVVLVFLGVQKEFEPRKKASQP